MNKPKAKRNGIVLRGSNKIITSFSDGIVYYSDSNNVLGKYDANGKIYNKDNNYIGYVSPDKDGSEVIVLNREYQYSWLKNNLRTDSAINNPAYRPAMEIRCGDYWSSWIEAPDGMQCDSVYIVENIDDRNNKVGACAAYVVAINEGLLNKRLDDFYLSYNVQKECYFRAKNNNIGQ